jgi:hypothetical protein
VALELPALVVVDLAGGVKGGNPGMGDPPGRQGVAGAEEAHELVAKKAFRWLKPLAHEGDLSTGCFGATASFFSTSFLGDMVSPFFGHDVTLSAAASPGCPQGDVTLFPPGSSTTRNRLTRPAPLPRRTSIRPSASSRLRTRCTCRSLTPTISASLPILTQHQPVASFAIVPSCFRTHRAAPCVGVSSDAQKSSRPMTRASRLAPRPRPL